MVFDPIVLDPMVLGPIVLSPMVSETWSLDEVGQFYVEDAVLACHMKCI